MNKIIACICFMTMLVPALAQEARVNHMTTFDDKWIHFGFTLGVNTMDFGLVHYNPIGENTAFVEQAPQLNNEARVTENDFIRADVSRLIPGFTVGIITDLRLSQDLNLRFLPGLSFGERQLTYNRPVYTGGSSEAPYYSIKSTFLDFPLLLKYKARRINNDRPYIVFGPAYRHNISRSSVDHLVRLKDGGLYAEMGVGWDHYFTFFRFSVEGKFSIGLDNQLGPPPGPNERQYYSNAIKHLRSKMFTLSFHFE